MTLRAPRALRPHVGSVFGTFFGVGAPLALIVVGSTLTHADPRAVLVGVLTVQTAAIALFIGAALTERASLREAAAVDSAA
jgi:hypothetical protein